MEYGHSALCADSMLRIKSHCGRRARARAIVLTTNNQLNTLNLSMCIQTHTHFIPLILIRRHSFNALLCTVLLRSVRPFRALRSRCVLFYFFYFFFSFSLNVTARVYVCLRYIRLCARQSTKIHSVIQFTYVKHLRIWPNSHNFYKRAFRSFCC